MSQDNAAGALASLASKHSENRQAVAKRLVGLLNGRQVERAVRVLGALASLSKDHAANQLAIAKVGGIPPVISWLGSASEDAQREAAHAVLAIATNNVTTQSLISKSAGIPPLIAIIKRSSVEAQEHAANALWHLASTPENQTAIAEANGIEPLVAMLSADGLKAPELAAVTIVRLAKDNLDVAKSIASCHGIRPLVGLLTNGSPAAQQEAASALSELGQVPRNRNQIAQAGGIEPLIKLLSSQTVGTPETAARALAHLARSNDEVEVDAEEDVSDEDDEEEEKPSSPDGAAKEEDKENEEEKPTPATASDEMPSSPSKSTSPSPGKKRRSIVTSSPGADGPNRDREKRSVVALDADMENAVAEAAAATERRKLMRRESDLHSQFDGPTRRREIKRAGGIAKLIGMLEGFTGDQRSPSPHAAAAMRGRRTGDAGANEGMWQMVQQVVHGQVAEEPADLRRIRVGMQEQAAQALCDLAYRDNDMQDAIIEAGGVLPLLMLVKQVDSELAQEYSARAIWHLCETHYNQHHIVEEGAITELVNLVIRSTAGNPAAAEVAAAGLAELADGGVAERKLRRAKAECRAQRREMARQEQMRMSRRSLSPTSSASQGGTRSPQSGTPVRMPGTPTVATPPAVPTPPHASPRQGTSETVDAARVAASTLVAAAAAAAPVLSSAEALSAAPAEAPAGAPSPIEPGRPRETRARALTLGRSTKLPLPPSMYNQPDGLDGDSDGSTDDDMENDRLLAIKEAGGIPPLVALVQSAGMTAKEHAAAALWHLALDSSNQLAIARANGVTPLVALLDDGSYVAVQNGANALSRLAEISSDNQAQIAKRLVSLLTVENEGAQERSAQALWALASNQPESPTVIVNAGAISPLVNLLASGTLRAKQQAAGALSTLAINNPHNQLAIAIGLVALLGNGDTDAEEHVTKLLLELSADGDNRKAIAEAGAIERIVLQLKSESVLGQELAASVLNYLICDGRKNIIQCAESGGVRPLVALLSSTSTVAQSQAALVIAAMTKGTDNLSNKNQASVASEGGIGPLVALLTAEGDESKAAAAGALWSLARGLPETQAAVADAGAVQPLVNLLKSKDSKQQLKAAGALSGLAAGNPINQDAVTAADGIPPLVALLGSGNVREVQAHAADALAEICRDHMQNQTAVARAGAIEPLIALLGENSSHTFTVQAKEMAAGALWALSARHSDNQTAVAQARGIQPLVDLLGTGSDQAQIQAAGALASLALNHEENELSVSEKVMTLLDYSSKPGALPGTAEKAARAISRLADSDGSHQNALAQAGGIEKLVAMIEITPKQKLNMLRNTRHTKESSVSSVSQLSDETPGRLGDETQLRRRRPSVSHGPGTPPSISSPALSASPGVALPLTPPLLDGESSPVTSLVAVESTSGSSTPPEGLPPSLAASGGAAPTVDHLNPAAQKEISGALWSMALDNPDNQKAIAKVGGIPKLIALLKGDSVVHRNAAGALWSLASDGQNAQVIAEQDGIEPLVILLHKNGGKAQDAAAGALHGLAAIEVNRTRIADARGIKPLVAVFDGGSAAAVKQASGALTELVNNNQSNQTDVSEYLVDMLKSGSVAAQENVTSLMHNLSLDPEMRGPIASKGGIQQLVRQLEKGNDNTQQQAAKALSQIALKSAMLRVQVTQQLVELLGNEGEEVRQRAGVALRDMADSGGDESQKMVAMAGGVAPLVALLKDGLADGRVEAQEYALWSLSLATDAASRATIKDKGGIELLVMCLNTGELSQKAQEDASSVMAGLARDSDNREDMTHPEHDSIPPLVALLSNENTMGAKKNAATALARLAVDSETTQLAIGKAGAITALVSWLTTDIPLGPGMVELAARALADIASDNVDTSQQIVDAGAVEPLVTMLEAGRGNDAHKSASGCLATLTKSDFLQPEAVATARSRVQDPQAPPKAAEDDPGEVTPAPAPAPAKHHAKDPLERLTAMVIARAGGIPPLVELVKSERSGPHENASRAIWQLAQTADNQHAIAKAGGVNPLVALLSTGSAATQRHAAAAIEGLARDCHENQLALAKAKAIAPLVTLLGSESMETQEHAEWALLYLAMHAECRNAVVRRLVQVLDMRNANAQLRAAGALAILSSRNATYRNAIYEAGAIPPLVRQLGDGLRVENDTPQERAACVLADLARSPESKDDIVEAKGVEPLVRMLGSRSNKAQTAASVALSHLACTGENKIAIANAGGIGRLVAVLQGENKDAKRPATAALCQLANCSENKTEIVEAKGIPLLVHVMNNDAQTQESTAQILAELAKGALSQKHAIVDAGGVDVIATALKEGSPTAQRFAASAFWGLASCVEFKRPIIDAGAVSPLVNLLRNSGDAQGYAVAALSLLAEIGEGKKHIFMSHGVEPLLDIAKSSERAWLRGQAVDVLAYLNIKDPLEDPTVFSPNLSPRTPRAGSLTARGSAANVADDGAGGGDVEEPEAPRDPLETLVTIVTKEVMQVVANSKPLQLRSGFDISSEKAGELLARKAVHIIEERMTDDGKTRMCVSAEGSVKPLGWITGRSADNKSNLKEAGHAVMQVIAAKALVAREGLDLASPKVKDLAAGAYVHVKEIEKTFDGAYRIGYAMEGKDVIKGWVTAISKDGALNLNVAVAEARRGMNLSADVDKSDTKEAKDGNSTEKEDEEKDEEMQADRDKSPTKKSNRRASTASTVADDIDWSTPVAFDDAVPATPVPDLTPQACAETPLAAGKTPRRASFTVDEAPVEPSPAEPTPLTSRRKSGSAADLLAKASAPSAAPPAVTPEDVAPESAPITARRKSAIGADTLDLPSKAPVPEITPPAPTPPSALDAPQATARKKSAPQIEQSPLGTGRGEQPARSEQPLGTGRRSSLSSTTPRATAPGTTPRAASATPREKTSPSSSSKPVTAGPSGEPVFLAAGKLKMRAKSELDSDEAGTLPVGTRVIVMDRRDLADGTTRARVGRASDAAPLGWVSMLAKDGRANLDPLPAGASAAAGSKAPVSQQSATAGFAALPPTSSGALTARSTAKAAATAGIVKASLPSAALAAAQSAAHEAVAAQAAAEKAVAKATAAAGAAIASAPAAALAAVMNARNLQRPPTSGSSFHAGQASTPKVPSSPNTPGRAQSPMTPGRATPTTPRRGNKSARGSSPFGSR